MCDKPRDFNFKHNGTHGAMQIHIVKQPLFADLIHKLKPMIENLPADATDIAITLRCRSGKHRSVAVVELLAHVFGSLGYAVHPKHASLEEHGYRRCPYWRCECSGPPTTTNHREAQAVVERLWAGA